MFLFQIFEELSIFLQNHVIQELCELVIAELTGQSDKSFLKEPFVEEIELLSCLRHVFVLVLRLEN